MAKRTKLTAQQEAFVDAIIAGKSQRDAYRIAYPKSEAWKDSSVDSKASTLFKNVKVQARYEELLEEYKEHAKLEAFYSKDEAIIDLLKLKQQAFESIEENGVRQANGNIVISCVDKLCTLIDLYPNKSKQVDLSVDAVIDNNNPFAELTVEQLLKLAGEEADTDD